LSLPGKDKKESYARKYLPLLAFLIAAIGLLLYFTVKPVIQDQLYRQTSLYVIILSITGWLALNYVVFLLLLKKINLPLARRAYLINIIIGLLASEVLGFSLGYNFLIPQMYLLITLLLTLAFWIQEMIKNIPRP
jgi:hypothetical protein